MVLLINIGIDIILNKRNNIGGVVRVVYDDKARLNDSSKMAYVEFLDK